MTTTPATQPTTSPAPGRPLHDAGDETTEKLYRGKTVSDWAIRIVLVAVMTAALAVGTWSIYTLLTKVFQTPDFVAVLGCGMFDGAALFFALLSQRYATTTDSGLAPRAAMLVMVGASSWVNWKHAQIENWGTVGGVILASAPAIAELAFLMFHRFAHRETLRNLGRVPQALPTLGKWAWLAHPHRSGKTVDAHIKAALTEHEAIADRREELAEERARNIVSAHAHPTAALARDAHAYLTTPAQEAAPAPALTLTTGAQMLSEPVERPALTAPALSNDAHKAERPAPAVLPADDERAADAERERAQVSAPKAERARGNAQSAPSLSERKALKGRQDVLTLTLYTTLGGRPEWTEIRDALVSAGLESVSRPTAQRIRERVEAANPELPRERRTALSATN
ncbi:hypothetical protein [Streptomyces sp. NPDC002403]